MARTPRPPIMGSPTLSDRDRTPGRTMSAGTPATTGYPRTALPLASVTIDDAFWSPRQELVRTRTLRQQEAMVLRNGQFDALTLTWRPGDPNEPHIFWESDVAKWIEAASYCLAVTDDPELDASVDRAIALLAGAQQPDGYLNTYFTVVRPGERFTDLRDAHELYCAGHLIEAAVAHHEATGKTSLLGIVRRYADLIDATFAPGGACEGGYCGHEEIELALVKLYRATGERRYLDLGKRLVDARGTQPFYFDIEARKRTRPGYFDRFFPERADRGERFREYNQSHQPVADQQEIVGHCVRAMYLLSGVTDLAAECGDPALLAAAKRLWDDLVAHKLYVTGGVGADPSIEGFGRAYDLPNAHGYAETCAAIGLVQWARRMNAITGEGRYVDVLERALYNAALSGASADGTHYFYGNPLASDGTVERKEWFGVACCPPNLARLISELGHYVYTHGEDEAGINLYVAGSARFDLAGRPVVITQETDYPRSGHVRVTLQPPDAGARFTLALRIPAWSAADVRVNGVPYGQPVVDGYLRVHRDWTPGDTVELDLDLTPRRTWAHPDVRSAAGKVALERGPIVYCFEGVDHDSPVAALRLPRGVAVSESVDEATGEITLHADGSAAGNPSGDLYRDDPPELAPARLTATPYYQWGNRGLSDMAVWINEE